MHPIKDPAASGHDPTFQQSDLRNRNAGKSVQTSPIETGGELFSDGKTIELIKEAESGRLWLLASDGEKQVVGASIEVGGRVYVPTTIDSSILRGVTLPANSAPYESTNRIFATIRECFANNGFREGVALAATYFVFATWFTDYLPTAPCLVITGPRPEASLLLRLFSCLVRHPMYLIGFNVSSFRSVPMILQPTFLIDHELGPSMMKLLIAANNRHAQLTSEDGAVNVYSAKAIYRGCSVDEMFLGDGVLYINLLPTNGRLPLLGVAAERAIEKQFQPQLLMYRTKNIAKVRDSKFDFPELSSGIRILARILGAAIVDAPEIQAGLRDILQGPQERLRMGRWLDPKCVVIEAALEHSHRASQDRAYVGELAATATDILHGRGEGKSVEVKPKEIGAMLRSSFGIFPKRDAKGFAVHMTDEIRSRIHRIARDFDVAAMEEPVARCKYCAEVFSNGDRGSSKLL